MYKCPVEIVGAESLRAVASSRPSRYSQPSTLETNLFLGENLAHHRSICGPVQRRSFYFGLLSEVLVEKWVENWVLVERGRTARA